jgi:hypothetical protein
MWDKHLTKDQNYARLGLHSKQNSNEKVFEKHLSTVPESKYAGKENVKVLTLQELPEPGIPAPPKNKVEFPPGEILVLEEFIKKYASDYKKMAMDYKLNTYQMTPKKIEKRIVKYRQYLKEQE